MTTGLSVVMIDVDEERIARGVDSVASSLDRLVKKAKLSAADRDAALGRLRSTTDYGALRTCDFIVEAATEDDALKRKLLRQVDAVAKDDAIVASNTSSISMTKLAAATGRAQRFLGLHFFNPVPLMALVEVVRGRQTDDSTVKAALAKRLGKTPVVVQDSPGFIVNRLLCPMFHRDFNACAVALVAARRPAELAAASALPSEHQVGNDRGDFRPNIDVSLTTSRSDAPTLSPIKSDADACDGPEP